MSPGYPVQLSWPSASFVISLDQRAVAPNMFAGVLALLTLMSGGTAHASDTDLSRCRGVADDKRRLTCFDQLAGNLRPDVPGWVYADTGSAFDTSRKLAVTRRADATSLSRTNSRSAAELSIACDAGVPKLSVSYPDLVANSTGTTQISYRFDDGTFATEQWSGSGDLKSYGLWTRETMLPFLEKLLSAQTLSIKSEAWSFSPTQATFSLAGLADAIKPVREACNW